MIFRVNKTKNYTVMSNAHLREKSMTLRAKGLLSVMLSLPENWDYSIAGLAAINAESENIIKQSLDELKRFGYLVVTKLTPRQTESGRYEYIYDIYEQPQKKQDIEKQDIEKQDIEKQGVEFQGLENWGVNKYTDIINTKEIKTKEINTKEINTEKQTPPTAAMPDKSGESITANDTLNATLKGSIESIDTSIASIKEEFELLWAIYPNKQGKQHAYKAYERARKRKQDPVTYEQVKAGIEKYCAYIAAKGISKQYIKHGSTYFNGAEWESEYDLTPVQQYQPQAYQKPQTETKKWATAEGDHEPPEVIMGVMTIQEFAEQQPRSFAISYYEYYKSEQWAKEWANAHKEVLENAGAK